MDMDDSDQEDEAAPPLPPGPPPPPQHGEVSEERGRGEGEGDEEAAFIVPYVFLHTYADIHVRLSVKKWKHIPPFLRFRRFPRDEETQITVRCASVRAAFGWLYYPFRCWILYRTTPTSHRHHLCIYVYTPYIPERYPPHDYVTGPLTQAKPKTLHWCYRHPRQSPAPSLTSPPLRSRTTKSTW